jgi:hypothetical protein
MYQIPASVEMSRSQGLRFRVDPYSSIAYHPYEYSTSEQAFLEPWTWENRKAGLQVVKPDVPIRSRSSRDVGWLDAGRKYRWPLLCAVVSKTVGVLVRVQQDVVRISSAGARARIAGRGAQIAARYSRSPVAADESWSGWPRRPLQPSTQ